MLLYVRIRVADSQGERGTRNTEQGLPEKNKTRKNMENNKKPDQKRFDKEGKAQWNQGKGLRFMLRYCSFQSC